MLARRPIRTKLLVVSGAMLGIIVVLASSAFWGLYHYRHLAAASSQQAEEMEFAYKLSSPAHQLHADAVQLRRYVDRLVEEEPTRLRERLERFDRTCFSYTLNQFRTRLQEYEAAAERSSSVGIQLVNPDARKAETEALSDRANLISRYFSNPLIESDPSAAARLERETIGLMTQTDALFGLVRKATAELSEKVRNESRNWIVAAWVCVIGSFVTFLILGILFHKLVAKPFRTLIDGSRLIAKGTFSHRINLGTVDELSELADVVNQMTRKFQETYTQLAKTNRELELTCGELQHQRSELDRQVRDRTREVIQREQLASVGFLAAGVAHEINNPLASIAWSAESLESRMHDAIHGAGETRQIAADQAKALGENLKRIQDEAYRCKGITQRLLDFSRMGSIEKTRVDIGELFREVVEMLGTLGQYRCKTLRTDCPQEVTAMINGQQIRQVALNLLTNALESVDQDGAVDIRIRQERDRVVVTVQDNGCGMTDEVLEHLFEPFFTRRRDGKGTGLGLSITHRIVTQHGGTLTAHSEGPGRGSQMRLELPVEAAENADARKRAAPSGSETTINSKSEYAPLEAVNQKDPRDERRRVA